MDQLVNLVSQRTGIPPNQAQQAVQVVMGYLKDRLPGPMASQIDTIMAQGSSGPGMTNQPRPDPGGVFGQQP
jgi:hypothetical protein